MVWAVRARTDSIRTPGRPLRDSGVERTNLAAGAAGAVISIDAFQYAPRKRAAFAELARIRRPGARAGIVCFEVDLGKVAGLPVLGVDPVADYRPLMAAPACTSKPTRRRPAGRSACMRRSAPSPRTPVR
jgi:hypothetical protein